MPPTFRTDPYPGCNFEVLVTGVSDDGRSVRGSFAEVSGLGVSIDVIEYRNGSDDTTVRKMPGLRKFSNITLKRGIVADLAFWNWMVQSMKGSVQRTTISVVLLDEDRNEVLRWEFTRAWPCKVLLRIRREKQRDCN